MFYNDLSALNYEKFVQLCNKMKTGSTINGHIELAALATLCPSSLFYVIVSNKNAKWNISMEILIYGKDGASYEKRIFLLYDAVVGYYEPLSLYSNTNERENSYFKYNDEAIQELLIRYIKEDLKCKAKCFNSSIAKE